MFEHPFLFLRHGETDWNRERRTQGQTDTPLNATGRAQAAAAAEVLRHESIDRIVASPLTRVRDTASAVAAVVSAPISYDPALMEVYLGEMQGAPHDARNIAYWRGEHVPAGGESFPTFCDRVVPAIARAVALGPRTLVVCHGGLWHALCARVAVTPAFEMPNATPIRVTPTEGGLRADALAPLPESVSGEGAQADEEAVRR